MSIICHIMAIEHDKRNMLRIHRRQLRDAMDPFNLPEKQFMKLFHFNKESALTLLDEISPFMKDGVRKTFILKNIRLVAVLHYYATGSYYKDVGRDFLCTMSKTMIHRSIKEITEIIQDKLMPKYIRFPITKTEQNIVQKRIFNATGFPGVIGIINCCHIKIKKPKIAAELSYRNGRNFYSKNVQFVCDTDLNILSCYARFGGNTRDALIWKNSKVREFMENQHTKGNSSIWLVGDSAYPLQPWLMTPYNYTETDAQENFNSHHIRVRNYMARLNGALKKVFMCLSQDRGLLVSPLFSGAIINACCTLHNYRLKHKLPIPAVSDEPDFILSPDYNESPDETYLIQAQLVREKICKEYFSFY